MSRRDIRAAVAADYEWLYELHEAAHRELVEQAYGPWDTGQQQEFFRSLVEGHDVYVIEEDGPVGAVYLGTRDGHIWLELIEVIPVQQKRGVGTEALRWVLHRATEQGCGTSLQVYRLNPVAHRWYLQHGFVPVGETETHHILHHSSQAHSL